MFPLSPQYKEDTWGEDRVAAVKASWVDPPPPAPPVSAPSPGPAAAPTKPAGKAGAKAAAAQGEPAQEERPPRAERAAKLLEQAQGVVAGAGALATATAVEPDGTAAAVPVPQPLPAPAVEQIKAARIQLAQALQRDLGALRTLQNAERSKLKPSTPPTEGEPATGKSL
ncbi:hypothetical protein PAPYR_2330 [Paratrimastix pyriformis]|uniref:Uncharacterized protein n=1 Tax=Paratrimastix pyriformis TaxID=342808 RepID=A0ABQ8UQ54_9EUKA|nr:hypothetical protein PAPYR_2330 [Paratrimastix pyriformis]